jgi:hypothetical protein
MADQTYERRIFLHTNSVPEINYSFILKVQTAPLPRKFNQSLWNMVWKDMKIEFGTILAGGIFLLTAVLGISLTILVIGFALGLLNPFVIFSLLATSLSFTWMLINISKERSRLIAQYRKSQQQLIKP